jgi:hypothetical protein
MDVESLWRLARSSEARALLALALSPDAERGRLLLQHLRELDPPELIFAADWYLQRELLPEALRAEASKALRVRLSELAAASPRAMQYPAMLLAQGASPETPFSPRDLQELEAIASLPDWRETDFHTIFQATHRHLEAAGLPQYSFGVAVSALANEPAALLKRRAEASREQLSPEELRRLGEALWHIGERLAAESTLLERFMGLSLIREGATTLEDEARLQQAASQYDEARDAWKGLREAAPPRWPLHSLRDALVEAGIRDEMAYMRRFLPASPPAP